MNQEKTPKKDQSTEEESQRAFDEYAGCEKEMWGCKKHNAAGCGPLGCTRCFEERENERNG